MIQDALLFNTLWPVLVAMPFLGFLFAGLSKRTDPVIRRGKVLRHDGPARLAHWTHVIGVVFLLVSGVILGSRFSPSLVTSPKGTNGVFNMHFLFACFFLFGTCYWLGNTVISRYRFKEHLPGKNSLKKFINHYGSLLKIKGMVMPREEKYFESERIAFVWALVCACLMAATGLLKVLAHHVSVPGGFMNAVTWAHDVVAALMLLFLLAHVFFGVVLPNAWKTVPSMFTGYVSKEHAEKDYPAWMDAVKEATGKLEKGSAGREAEAQPKSTGAAVSPQGKEA